MKMQKITSDPSYSLQNGARVMFLIFFEFQNPKPSTLFLKLSETSVEVVPFVKEFSCK